jgi:Fe-S-cluster formation regulator IscX/YfhJ
MSDLDKLVKALCELNPELDAKVVRFVGESEGVQRLKDVLSSLLLVEQMKK